MSVYYFVSVHYALQCEVTTNFHIIIIMQYDALGECATALRNFTVIEQRWNANLHPQSHDCVN